jgi:hypothetical protein
MSWLASIGLSVLTGLLAGALGLGLGLACVRWYNITGFEGKSGYFVVAVMLLAMLLGFITGLVMARVQPAGLTPAFSDVLLRSGAVLTGLGLLVAALAWMMSPPVTNDEGKPAPEGTEESPPEPAPFTMLPAADAPFGTWLETLRYNGAPEIRHAIFAHLQSRPALQQELTDALRGEDDGLAWAALSALAELPANTLHDVDGELESAARSVISCLTRTVAVTAAEDPTYQTAANCSLRWSGWMQAVAARPAESLPMHITHLQRMIDLATSRPDSVALASQTQVAHHLLERWRSP